MALRASPGDQVCTGFNAPVTIPPSPDHVTKYSGVEGERFAAWTERGISMRHRSAPHHAFVRVL